MTKCFTILIHSCKGFATSISPRRYSNSTWFLLRSQDAKNAPISLVCFKLRLRNLQRVIIIKTENEISHLRSWLDSEHEAQT